MSMVSIIVPVYNVEKVLKRCLDSLCSQTLIDIEIICVNDGSTDTSLEILKTYEKSDRRIIIINKQNGGLSSARNAGLIVAKGKYIGFVDSDDFVEANMFELLFRESELFNCDLAGCGTKVIYEAWEEARINDNTYFQVKLGKNVEIKAGILSQMDVHVWNKIFRKDLIDKYQICFPDGLNYEDAPFLLNYLSVSSRVSFIDEKLYNYVRSSESIMGQTFSKTPRALDLVKVVNFSYDFRKNNNTVSDLSIDFFDYFIRNSILAFKYIPSDYYFKLFSLIAKSLSKFGFYSSFLILIRFNVKLFQKVIKRK